MDNDFKKTQILIVGLGAGGSVLFGKLAEAGFAVAAIEAGPHWDSDADFTSDERDMEKTRWHDPRESCGDDPLDICGSTSGKGVGGGTIHYTGMALRLHPSDFRTKTEDGVGVDWPIDYDELEPFYTEVEYALPVSGPDDFPWNSRSKPYRMPAHKQSCVDDMFRIGADKLGIKAVPCPMAIITEPMAGRLPCINRGFCEQGCKPRAKSSTIFNYVPRGQKAGGRIIANAMVTKVKTDPSGRTATGVTYVQDGREHELDCDLLILSAFTIETPRLLLNNASEAHPHGLANSSGTVGKYLMCHTDHVVYARFEDPLRIYRNPPVTSISEDFYETRPEHDFVRGFSIAPYSGRPISFALGALPGRPDLWGQKLRDFMQEYNFWLQLGMIGEVLPYEHNRVELSDTRDELGLPIPRAHFSLGDNEQRMIDKAYRVMEEIMLAAGAVETFRTPLLVHLMGTARMGDDPAASVVDRNLKAHDLDNFYICGAAVFPTSGAVNPTLTVQALAARLADHLISTHSH
jgi:choline dehydrogenase-like flavoprotein